MPFIEPYDAPGAGYPQVAVAVLINGMQHIARQAIRPGILPESMFLPFPVDQPIAVGGQPEIPSLVLVDVMNIAGRQLKFAGAACPVPFRDLPVAGMCHLRSPE